MISVLQLLVGRPRLVKFARLLSNETRLDTSNDIARNGEVLVQQAALKVNAPVVLDVGAHFGEWSLSLLNQAGNRPLLHAFEPSRTTSDRAIVELGSHATVHTIGMSDSSGQAQLNIVHEGAGANSVVPFSTKGRSGSTTESIELSTVDDFCAAWQIARVTLLKIDAEGHDLAVMRGAHRMLSSKSIDMVQFEYNWRWVESRTFLLDAFELLAPLGYALGKVTPKGIETYDAWHPELESFREGNYLGMLPHLRNSLPSVAWWGG